MRSAGPLLGEAEKGHLVILTEALVLRELSGKASETELLQTFAISPKTSRIYFGKIKVSILPLRLRIWW